MWEQKSIPYKDRKPRKDYIPNLDPAARIRRDDIIERIRKFKPVLVARFEEEMRVHGRKGGFYWLRNRDIPKGGER